jgi:hypothetical protein
VVSQIVAASSLGLSIRVLYFGRMLPYLRAAF